MQAAFTPKELRELLTMPNIKVHVSEDDMQLTEADEDELKSTRMKKRIFDIIAKTAQAPNPPGYAKEDQMCREFGQWKFHDRLVSRRSLLQGQTPSHAVLSTQQKFLMHMSVSERFMAHIVDYLLLIKVHSQCQSDIQKH